MIQIYFNTIISTCTLHYFHDLDLDLDLDLLASLDLVRLLARVSVSSLVLDLDLDLDLERLSRGFSSLDFDLERLLLLLYLLFSWLRSLERLLEPDLVLLERLLLLLSLRDLLGLLERLRLRLRLLLGVDLLLYLSLDLDLLLLRDGSGRAYFAIWIRISLPSYFLPSRESIASSASLLSRNLTNANPLLSLLYLSLGM